MIPNIQQFQYSEFEYVAGVATAPRRGKNWKKFRKDTNLAPCRGIPGATPDT